MPSSELPDSMIKESFGSANRLIESKPNLALGENRHLSSLMIFSGKAEKLSQQSLRKSANHPGSHDLLSAIFLKVSGDLNEKVGIERLGDKISWLMTIIQPILPFPNRSVSSIPHCIPWGIHESDH